MTKQEAIAKVAKLQRLAQGSSNPHEAEAAKLQIAKLSKKYDLSAADMVRSRVCAAYDDLVDQLEAATIQIPIDSGVFSASSTIRQATSSLKGAADSDKASRVKIAANVIRAAGWILGSDPYVAKVKTILEDVLKKHDVVI